MKNNIGKMLEGGPGSDQGGKGPEIWQNCLQNGELYPSLNACHERGTGELARPQVK